MNYYDVLQVSTGASDEVIKAAYKSLVKKYHPDAGIEKDGEKFRIIEEAYNILSNPEKRKEYDESLVTRESQMPQSSDDESISVVVKEKEEDDSKPSKSGHRVGDFFLELLSLIRDGIEWLFGAAVLIFIVWCLFIGNGEKLKMNLLNLIGQEEYSKEGTEYNVSIYTKFDSSFLSGDTELWLNVDGERVALLGSGKQNVYNTKLTEGKHIVFVESKFWHINSEKLYIDIDQDNIFFFTVESGTWSPKITNGV